MDQRQYEAMLADTEIRLKRLRTLYDQWFHGLERAEPQKQKEELEKLIADLKYQQPRNTALRFRMNQLAQRYLTYNTYWVRITRQIEEGTYKRDVLRAKRRFGPQAKAGADARAAKPDAYELDVDIDVEAAVDAVRQSEPPPAQAVHNGSSWPPARDSERPSRAPREITPFALPGAAPPGSGAPPRPASGPLAPAPAVSLAAPFRPPSGPISAPLPPAGAPPSLRARGAPPPVPPGASRKPPPPSAPSSKPAMAAPPSAGHGMSDEQILNIYQRYVSARRDNKERIDNVRIESVAKTVREMLPKLKEKHAGKQIDFEVVVKDGRVALKPVPK